MTEPRSGERVIPPAPQFAEKARIGALDKYRALYDRSISDPDGFWAEQADRITWFKKWDKVSRWDFHTGKIEWFIGGETKASFNCLDRPVASPRKTKGAAIWEGGSPGEARGPTSHEPHPGGEEMAHRPKQQRGK